MNDKSRRILIFSTAYLPFIGGAELALKEITDRIKDVEFDLITLNLSNNLLAQEDVGNIHIYRLSSGKILFPIHAFLKARMMNKNLGPYDIVFALQASYGAGAAWLYKLFNPKIKFILNIQEGKNLIGQGFLINFFRNLIIKKADTITVISRYLGLYAKNINPKIPVTIIPNGVDLNKFKVKSGKLKVDEKIIISVSRLVKKNGPEDLIDAFAIVKASIPNSKLLIIGAGELEESLKSKVKNLKLDDSSSFLGEVSHNDLPKYLTEADVFVRPSLSEGLGTAFLEAMACGVPIIGTAQGGITDFLEDKKTGLFCNVNDPKDLAEKIILLLNDGDLRNHLIISARQLVEERYNWNKIASQYQTIFTTIWKN